MSSKHITEFQNFILSWYQKNKRDLPWRQTRDPYNILVSEIMSQQTQISRVIPKYNLWLEKFPTIQDLANAKTAEVLTYWSGLGYNRRGLYLQKCAQEIVAKFNGKFPQTEKALLALPGIGEYTARAILCFAFNKQIAVIDTNIKKVILTKFSRHPGKSKTHPGSIIVKDSGVTTFPRMTKEEIKEIANQLLPKGRAYEWNQALMDYASLELKKEKIAIPKQLTFKNSNRYFRGQIIKYLVANTTGSQKDFLNLFNNAIDNTKLENILHSLVIDNLIIKDKNNSFSLP